MHHPLVHTSQAIPSGLQTPPSFRQHAIDQTLLHAKWVVRLVGRCKEKQLELNDPFLAHLVAVTASALIFFAHASSERIRGEATRGFDRCVEFVESFSHRFTHIRHMESRLRSIRQSSIDRSVLRPKAESTLLWSLLNYASSTSPLVPDQQSGSIELQTPTEHLAQVDDAAAKEGGEEVAGQQDQTTLASDALDMSILDSFDAGLPSFFADNGWYEMGQL
ncbi:hypothetical protein PRZ48_004220 [Zasmidium cellare]|uniref:Fungal specific transcription factor n=1 Tax=Zasmidium cellare TaxID=395010 RepID=A0ABR0EXT9_ZASCE|nr:hypothetical protein PRZ48_004220 [Zasmidium cellare]